MPTIVVKYDDNAVTDKEITELGEATIKIAQKITGIQDSFVYADSAHIKINIAPIELYIYLSEKHIPDLDALYAKFKAAIVEWKVDSGFAQPVNFTLVPMRWKFEVGL